MSEMYFGGIRYETVQAEHELCSGCDLYGLGLEACESQAKAKSDKRDDDWVCLARANEVGKQLWWKRAVDQSDIPKEKKAVFIEKPI